MVHCRVAVLVIDCSVVLCTDGIFFEDASYIWCIIKLYIFGSLYDSLFSDWRVILCSMH